ncbi:molybdenum ABC transporter, periplasmic molybdenum-binding protein [Vibrio ichthyoenteri ATCC 700023]|uniref:Molybdenum ABC transporter, periplasmic molybdenum-binding protein n=1 Tax=Vibrio ichthyoenteri ATCC 700023 TaxID=870968 RepID=F9RXM5_9VIBR|nr:molybdate ABC transporter substrate-binding protein [Vibrio ichthyoenteri]EGU47805.1 molybdenum ABC transporter, periplasmic molybdenum-binding protein [Vibrio ichthyoenteri ATCC 700023]
MKLRIKCFTLFAALILSGPLYAGATDKIRVYAASSMTNALDALVKQYKQSHDVTIVPIYGGSSSLARQIEQGAPADIYISANSLWVERLVASGIAKSQDVSLFARNQLVVIAPIDRAVELDGTNVLSWQTALNGQRLAIGQPNAVPAGIYAKQALEELGIWSTVSQSLAPTNNVRTALTLVERGETPLGIVYQTDAQASDKTKVIYRFAANTHQEIRYPMVTLSHNDVVNAFSNYLKTEDAQQTLRRFGFE